MSDSTVELRPDDLIVLACPVCKGQVAATVSLCGQAACCPLCASLFQIPPRPGAAAAPPVEAEPQQQPGGVAEDWGAIIAQLAAPRAAAEPEGPLDAEWNPEPDETPVGQVDQPLSGVENPTHALPAQRDGDMLAPASDGLFQASTAPVAEPVVPTAALLESEAAAIADEPRELPAVAEPPPAAEVPPVLEAPDIAEAAAAENRRQDAPPEAPADSVFAGFGAAPLTPREDELAFKEPVRTVQRGRKVIELRRLSPKEREARRFRRNLMMVVVGVSILLVIVLLFGLPTKRR